MHDEFDGGGLRLAAPATACAGERFGFSSHRADGSRRRKPARGARLPRRHDNPEANRPFEPEPEIPGADSSSVAANVGACALILFALLLPTGWPQALVNLLVEVLR